MKTIIIDRDRDSVERLKATLEERGAVVQVTATKAEAAEILKNNMVDCIFFDPYPQTAEARAFILMVRRTYRPGPSIVLIGHGETRDDAIKMGANDLLSKPYTNAEQVAYVADSALRIINLGTFLAEEAEDFPSKDGIIGKTAFHQLFLACLDRADRYAELSYYIQIDIENYDALGAEGPKVANNLRQELVRIKRLSDLGGQLSASRFGLLLMRPMIADEPTLAANRIAEFIMRDFPVIVGNAKPNIRVELIELPTGKLMVEHFLPN